MEKTEASGAGREDIFFVLNLLSKHRFFLVFYIYDFYDTKHRTIAPRLHNASLVQVEI